MKNVNFKKCFTAFLLNLIYSISSVQVQMKAAGIVKNVHCCHSDDLVNF